MKTLDMAAKLKDGTEVVGQIVVPESLEELLKLYSEKRVFQLGLSEYILKCKKRLISTRSRRITFRLSELTTAQQIALRKLGLLE